MSDGEHGWAQDHLEGYLAGDLGTEDRDRLDLHLGECPECQARLRELAGPGPAESDGEDSPGERSPGRSPRRAWAIRLFLGVGALAVLGLIGFVITRVEEGEAEASELSEVKESPGSGASSSEASERLPAEPRARDVFVRRGLPKDDAAALPTDEPAIFFPETKESDHAESADDEAFRAMKGDSQSFLSYIKGEAGGFRGPQAGRSAGAYDTMGVGMGGGGGGRYGGRYGGRQAQATEVATPSFIPGGASTLVHGAALPVSESRAEAPAAPRGALPSVVPSEQEPVPAVPRKVIRSGDMEFEVDSFERSIETLGKIAVEEQGFISTLTSEKLPNGKVRGTAVVRVPPERLDTLLLKLRALGELKFQKIASEDVTRAYFDLESRLRASRTMEERLLRMIQEGKGSIKDLLQAEKELGEWRTRTESLQGEITYYNSRIALSTLSIALAERELRAPATLLEAESVDLGVEVEDVEKAARLALAAISESKGRVTRSEVKQLEAGQWSAVIQCEVPAEQSGALRDRLRALGTVAKLEVDRTQQAQGGTGRPQDPRIERSDTRMMISLYNVADVAPRETVQLELACADPEAAYRSVLERVRKVPGRIVSSNLARLKEDQASGNVQFQVPASEADRILADVRALGEVLTLEVRESRETSGVTRSKRGFTVILSGLSVAQPRETLTVVVAARDVAAGYRGLLELSRKVGARILSTRLLEEDPKNVIGELALEVRREQESELQEGLRQAGPVYSRTARRAQEVEHGVDSKVGYRIRLFDAATIPARETVHLSVQVGDVEEAARIVEGAFRGRVVDSRQSRERSGERSAAFTLDVPLGEAPEALGRLRHLGAVVEDTATRNAGVPENALAVARLEVRVWDQLLVSSESGPWARLRKGLSISLQAASWSLMLIMIGVCFVLPIALLAWGAYRLKRRLRPETKPAPAA